MSEGREGRLRFAEFEFEPRSGRLFRAGDEIVLQPRLAEVLEVLLRRPGEVVTRDELLDACWPGVHVTEAALNQVVSKLRRALDDHGAEPRFIHTHFKRGYRFLAPVEAVPVASLAGGGETALAGPGDVVAAPTPAPGADRSPSSGRPWRRYARPLGVGFAVLAVAAVAVAAWWRFARPAPAVFEPGALRATRLTFDPAREQEGSFAADGRTFVYVRNDPAAGQLDLYLGSLAGGQRVRLTHGPEDEFYPQFAPDGSAILFTRAGAGEVALWRISPLGGDERRLVAGAAYGAWSPDGAEVVFVRAAAARWELVRRRLTDGAERRLAAAEVPLVSPAWSPRGGRIAYTDGRSLWVVDAAGGSPPWRLGPEAEILRSLAWEAGSGALICDANWGGRANLWRVPLDGSPPAALTLGSGGAYHPAVALDGRRLLYTQEKLIRRLARLDPAGARPRALAIKPTVDDFDLAPDGRRLAWTDFDSGTNQSDLLLTDLESGATRTLLRRRGEPLGPPSFDRAGGRLAVIGAGEETALWLIDLADDSARTLALPDGLSLGDAARAAWTADGADLILPGGLGGEAGLVRLAAGGAEAELLAAGRFRAPAVSPDGRRLAAFGTVEGEAGLHLVDLGSGEVRRLAAPASFSARPLWDAGGAAVRVLVGERRRPALRTFDLEGREIAPELPLEPLAGESLWGLFDLVPLPAGGWLGLQVDYEGDLYLLEQLDQQKITTR
jgi:DNA-binding winged helix-turn-helix (wHTH) protein/Tol biopolymer transport system component